MIVNAVVFHLTDPVRMPPDHLFPIHHTTQMPSQSQVKRLRCDKQGQERVCVDLEWCICVADVPEFENAVLSSAQEHMEPARVRVRVRVRVRSAQRAYGA